MKKLLSLIATCFILSVNAQTISFNPRTGDIELDNILKDINTKAKDDLSAFVQNAVTTFNVAKNTVDGLLKDLLPGDAFMVLQTAQVVNKPIETISTTYQKNKDKGWGQIAKELGIKPGSAEFHALKGKAKNNGKGKEKAKGNSKGKSNGKKA
ncbi:MAG: hypothetical protein V4677_11275 [Bacteroidota bacterium]